MKKNLIVTTIFIGAIAICFGIYANHNTAKDDLIRQNIEALAQVTKPGWMVGCIIGPWGEGTPHTDCINNCDIIMADSWSESGYCTIY